MDPDYRMAVFLQKQFEQETFKSSSPPPCPRDFQLAISLQEQFKNEVAVEKPGNNLVYESKKSKHKKDNLNSSKCLVDPSWEVIDPTPDIHNLFMAFNERFFWNKLLTVCVSWSKRMTTCAGVCSYQGRGGLCSITLSEPLLKLRPRKDLVETLLHEMIHAYLFVTHNNKDRDGHGPQFHKHMYRINGEAGTNITVYHDFHDEVKLYKTHWWRCDGPCQKRPPFFGMVKRAQNRAPGPNDLWWAQHSSTCGGKFNKVREPEKKAKAKSSKENKIPKPKKHTTDIRNFLPNKPQDKVHTISDSNSSNAKVSTVIPKVGNVFGFTNLSGGAPSSSKAGTSQIKGLKDLDKNVIKGSVRNATSNTVVINKTATKSKKQDTVCDNSSKLTDTSSTGYKLSDQTQTVSGDYSVVRNHWLNKFGVSTSSNGLKRPSSSTNVEESSSKIPKLSLLDKAIIIDQDDGFDSSFPSQNDKASCPVCGGEFLLRELNDHLDTCLVKKNTQSVGVTKECFICDKKIPESEFEEHVSTCLDNSIKEENTSDVVPLKSCYVCDEQIPEEQFGKHLSACLGDNFDSDSKFSQEDTDEMETKECVICCKQINKTEYENHMLKCSEENLNSVIDLSLNESSPAVKVCPVCQAGIECNSYELHIEKCLHNMYDCMEKAYSTNEETTCLACDKKILKTELNEHLDECLNSAFNCSDSNTEKQYNCPFCMKLFSEIEMNAHVNDCLNIVADEPEYEDNKKSLIDSFLDDDFDS